MEDYDRSRSFSYSNGPPTSYELRSYSSSYAQTQLPRDVKPQKAKTSSSSSSSKGWKMRDPEFQRKKRVASYKMYSVEGKVKGSFRRSFRWLKDRYTHIVYGWF